MKSTHVLFTLGCRASLRLRLLVQVVLALAGLSLVVDGKTPPVGNLMATFPGQGEPMAKGGPVEIQLVSDKPLQGKLSFVVSRYGKEGAEPSNALTFKGSHAIATGETRKLTVTAAADGAYEVAVSFDGGPGNLCVASLVIVAEKGKLWFGNASLMSVAGERAKYEAAAGGRTAKSAVVSGEGSRQEQLFREMSQLFQ